MADKANVRDDSKADLAVAALRAAAEKARLDFFMPTGDLPLGQLRFPDGWRYTAGLGSGTGPLGTWLIRERVAATVLSEDGLLLTVTPHSVSALRSLTEALTPSTDGSADAAFVAGEQLDETLCSGDFHVLVTAKAGTVQLEFSEVPWESREFGAVRLVSFLGGADSVARLDLRRHKARRKLTEYLRMVLTAAVGPLMVTYEPDTPDRQGDITCLMTPEQAYALAARLAAPAQQVSSHQGVLGLHDPAQAGAR